MCVESVCLPEQGQSDGTSHYLVQAKLAVLNKQFKQAEAILLERVSLSYYSRPSSNNDAPYLIRVKLMKPSRCTRSSSGGRTL